MVLICDDIWGNIISFHPFGIPIPSITFHPGIDTPTGVDTPACDVFAHSGLRTYASLGIRTPQPQPKALSMSYICLSLSGL